MFTTNTPSAVSETPSRTYITTTAPFQPRMLIAPIPRFSTSVPLRQRLVSIMLRLTMVTLTARRRTTKGFTDAMGQSRRPLKKRWSVAFKTLGKIKTAIRRSTNIQAAAREARGRAKTAFRIQIPSSLLRPLLDYLALPVHSFLGVLIRSI